MTESIEDVKIDEVVENNKRMESTVRRLRCRTPRKLQMKWKQMFADPTRVVSGAIW